LRRASRTSSSVLDVATLGHLRPLHLAARELSTTRPVQADVAAPIAAGVGVELAFLDLTGFDEHRQARGPPFRGANTGGCPESADERQLVNRLSHDALASREGYEEGPPPSLSKRAAARSLGR